MVVDLTVDGEDEGIIFVSDGLSAGVCQCRRGPERDAGVNRLIAKAESSPSGRDATNPSHGET